MNKNKIYGFDYETVEEIDNPTLNLKRINKIHKSLNVNNYLTHILMVCHNKDLTEHQKQYHLLRAQTIINNEKAQTISPELKIEELN